MIHRAGPLAVVAACAGPPVGSRETLDAPIGRASLDVLLVIDNSGDMMGFEALLAARIHRLIDALDVDATGSDLRIGVVTSDLGTLAVNTGDQMCNTSDDAQLQTSGCAGLVDRYLVDHVEALSGGHVGNYTGSLVDAVSCMVGVGHQGCGYEQHLEAMRTALSRPGFLRPEADLAVLVVGSEDDCSAYNPVFFAPDGPVMGADSSHRCFTAGTICDPDEPAVPGRKTGCRSREDSAYLVSIASYVELLRGLKPDPSRVVVATIVGAPEPVDVVLGGSSQGLYLQPSCSTEQSRRPAGRARPGVRLSQIVDELGDRGVTGSICGEDYPALTALGELALRSVTRPACFAAAVAPPCDVTLLVPGGVEQVVPACDDGATGQPCWRISVDPAVCPDGAHHHLDLVATPPVQPHSRVRATCDVE